FEKIKPRKIFDLTPYAVASADRYQAITGNPFATGKDYRLNGGLDAKIGVTNNMTLDLTINPDFGQVEADPSEVNLTAYETFFEEKRPFFVEGNNITNFSVGIGDGGIGNDNLFYSRRIGRRPQGYPSLGDDEYSDIPRTTTIISAAKLTGKTKNGLSIGFIETVTAEEKAEIDNEGTRTFQTVEPLTNYFVGRVQKDNNEGNTIIGGMFTSVNRDLTPNLENSLHKSAYSGGFDFTQYFKDKTWMFNVNAALSQVNGSELAIIRSQRSSARYFQRPDAEHVEVDSTRTSLTGTGGRMQIVKSGNSHWSFMGAVVWKSPEFEVNDMGYQREADNIIQVFWFGYRQWEPKGFYRNYNIGFNQYAAWTFGGEHMVDGVNTNGSITFKNFWNFNGGIELNFNSSSNAMLRGGPMMKMPASLNSWYNLGTDSRKKLVFRVNGGFNKGFSNSSSSYRIGGTAAYKPTNTLAIRLSPSYSSSNDQLQYVGRRSFEGDNRYIFATLEQKVLSMSLRVDYNLTPDLTLQYWGQPFIASGSYTDFKRITNNVAPEFGDRFEVYPASRIALVDNSTYEVNEDGIGPVDYSFGKPDFNIQEFLSNLVIRWEYNPGSTVYLVWSQTRSNFTDVSAFMPGENLGDLFDVKPYNVFLIKFSYRFGIK
ncbi:MAG: hydrolase, partial [Bacteroidales bacterium]|nr:hydrolase [Bacteroidales bacterium]